jgi:YHS domain-containing protein
MRLLTRAVCVCLLSVGLLAQSRDSPVDALDGLDPVLLVQGKEVMGKSALSVVRGGFTYLFSTPETKATFERDPATYEIQLGGQCARMGKTAGGNPSDFLVHDGKIYIFGSDECHKRFQAAPAKYLPPTAVPLPSSKEAFVRGAQLVERAVQSIGGAKRLDAVTSYVETFSQVQKGSQGDVPVSTKTMWLFPESVRQERTGTFQGKTRSAAQVISPSGTWFVGGAGQAYPQPEFARPSLKRDFGRHPVALLRARRDPTFKAAALEAATVEGARVERVRIVNGPLDVTLGLNHEGRIHSIAFEDRGNGGEYGAFTILYSNYRSVEDLLLPFGVKALFNGQLDASQTWTVDSIALNVPLDAALFAPKAATK